MKAIFDNIVIALANLRRRERDFLCLAGLLALLLQLNFLVIAPALNVFKIQQEYAQVMRKIDSDKLLISTFLKEKEKTASHEATASVSPAKLASFITIQSRSREDFKLKKISSEKTEKQGDLTATKLNIEVESSFGSLGKFIENIENSKMLARVENLNIHRIDKELRICRAQIGISGFTRSNP